MKKCNCCGYENNDNNFYCTSCGAKLPDVQPEVQEQPVTQEAPAYDRVRRCPKCGMPAKENDAFCTNCGEKIGNNNSQAYSQNYSQPNADPYASNRQAWHDPKVNPQYSNPNNGRPIYKNPDNDKPIRGGALGFVLSFFLGLIGLILALCLGDQKCRKAAIITFCVDIAVIVVIYIIIFASGAGAISYYYNYTALML